MLLLLSLVTGLFFIVLLLKQQWSPPLRLQVSHCSTFRIMCDDPSTAVLCSESTWVSHCSTFRIMCDVPNTAVFCSESTCNERFPSMVSTFFLEPFVTIPAAPVITGTILHFRFHICCISIYINSCILVSFPLHFAQHFYLRVWPHLSVCTLSIIIVVIIIIIIIISSSSPPSLLSSSSVSPLCRVSTLIFLRQTMSLGNTVLQLFWCNYSWCVYIASSCVDSIVSLR